VNTNIVSILAVLNISFEHNHNRVAFDICPVNGAQPSAMILGKEYDEGEAYESGKSKHNHLKAIKMTFAYYHHLESSQVLEMECNEHMSILDK
jgi:hypothetical protein